LENVEMPLYPTAEKSGDIRTSAVSLLKLLGLHDKINASASKLSGGEEQRVAVARALIHKPAMIFGDEPTGSLDEDTGTTIMREFKRISRRGKAILVATHDNTWESYADKLLHLRSGKLTSAR
jgi:putative ABC transport system ATP-binding protein